MENKINILFTGCTSKQTDDLAYTRARVNRIDDSSIICNSLRKQGFNVDRKKIGWGDDLTKYDLSIVGLGLFGSNNYTTIFDVIYAVCNSKKVIIFYEDWKIADFIKSYNSILKLTDDEIFKMINKTYSDGSPFYCFKNKDLFDIKLFRNVMTNLVNGHYDVLIPAFDWGNKEIIRNIIKSKNIYNIDLTPYVIENFNIDLNPINKIKEKKYMLASLADHSSWVKKMKLTWPTIYYGTKSIKDSIKLESEKEVCEECGKYIGILCPEYPHAGSGWFRIRYIYSAINNSVLIASEKDLNALGIEYKNIEYLSDKSINEYAIRQKQAILKHMWSKEQFDNKLNQIIKTCLGI